MQDLADGGQWHASHLAVPIFFFPVPIFFSHNQSAVPTVPLPVTTAEVITVARPHLSVEEGATLLTPEKNTESRYTIDALA